MQRSYTKEVDLSTVSQEILENKYTVGSENITKDIDRLLNALKKTMGKPIDQKKDLQSGLYGKWKDDLTEVVIRFSTDTRLFVSSAKESKEKMAMRLNESMCTLAHIFLNAQGTMQMATLTHQAQYLGFEVIKLTNSFTSTVKAAQAAVGKPSDDPNMKYLMRHATNLDQLLDRLLKFLKSPEQK